MTTETVPDTAPDERLVIQAAECPVIRAAYASGDTAVIKRMEAMHPPARCDYVKQAAENANG